MFRRTEEGLYEVRPPDLASFMLLEAAADVQQRSPMRRCLHCGFWMRAPKTSARYCDKSCRSMATQNRHRHKDNDNG